jgi:hypothetical protein
MKTRVAQATTIVLFALVMGVFWGTWFSLSRTMDQLSGETFVAVGHQMIQNLGVPMAILLPLSLVSALVTLVLLWQAGRGAAFWWALTGFLLMVTALVITVGAVPHRPDLHVDRRPGRGHHQRHGRLTCCGVGLRSEADARHWVRPFPLIAVRKCRARGRMLARWRPHRSKVRRRSGRAWRRPEWRFPR